TGTDIDALDDDAFAVAAESATIFARISPEQKARLIRLLRRRGRAVGFLGDGVNDALALHAADVGLSVDTATDVAKDAADVLLLEKDLDVLAGGVADGHVEQLREHVQRRGRCGSPAVLADASLADLA